MNRRRFLGACIATIAAPAIVRAESLMPVRSIARGSLGIYEQFRFIESPLSDRIAQLGRQLDDMDVPGEGRYLIVNPDMARILMEDLRPNKIWRVPDGPKIVINRWLPR